MLHMKALAMRGPSGEPIATPSVCWPVESATTSSISWLIIYPSPILKRKIPKTLWKSVHIRQEYFWNLSRIYKLAFSIRIIYLSRKDNSFTLGRSFTSSPWNKGVKDGIEFWSFLPQKTLSSCADDVYALLHAAKTRYDFLHPLNAFMLSFNKR